MHLRGNTVQDTGQRTRFLYSVNVIPANKLSLQELNQFIGPELPTSCFLENRGAYFQFPGGWQMPVTPCGRSCVGVAIRHIPKKCGEYSQARLVGSQINLNFSPQPLTEIRSNKKRQVCDCLPDRKHTSLHKYFHYDVHFNMCSLWHKPSAIKATPWKCMNQRLLFKLLEASAQEVTSPTCS